MKGIILVGCLFIVGQLKAQIISGSAIESGRKLVNTVSFDIHGSRSGVVVLEVAIDNLGKVTSSRLISEKSDVLSTPAVMMAKNAAKTFLFTPGTHFPEFQYALVRFNYIKD
jgi:hypothetical protein